MSLFTRFFSSSNKKEQQLSFPKLEVTHIQHSLLGKCPKNTPPKLEIDNTDPNEYINSLRGSEGSRIYRLIALWNSTLNKVYSSKTVKDLQFRYILEISKENIEYVKENFELLNAIFNHEGIEEEKPKRKSIYVDFVYLFKHTFNKDKMRIRKGEGITFIGTKKEEEQLTVTKSNDLTLYKTKAKDPLKLESTGQLEIEATNTYTEDNQPLTDHESNGKNTSSNLTNNAQDDSLPKVTVIESIDGEEMDMEEDVPLTAHFASMTSERKKFDLVLQEEYHNQSMEIDEIEEKHENQTARPILPTKSVLQQEGTNIFNPPKTNYSPIPQASFSQNNGISGRLNQAYSNPFLQNNAARNFQVSTSHAFPNNCAQKVSDNKPVAFVQSQNNVNTFTGNNFNNRPVTLVNNNPVERENPFKKPDQIVSQPVATSPFQAQSDVGGVFTNVNRNFLNGQGQFSRPPNQQFNGRPSSNVTGNQR